MAAPAQSDWTTGVDWQQQCSGIDFSIIPEPMDEDNLQTTVGHLPKIRRHDGGVGMAFIDKEEQKIKKREEAVEVDRVPGRYDHSERHNSHVARFQTSQSFRKVDLQNREIHLIFRSEDVAHGDVLTKLISLSGFTEECATNSNARKATTVTFCGCVENLTQLFEKLLVTSFEGKNNLRFESSSFSILSKFREILPLNGEKINAGTESSLCIPNAPQRRVTGYNAKSLCRINIPMKLVDADYGHADTVWILVLLKERANLKNTKQKLANEEGLWTQPHAPTKIRIPPAKCGAVEMGRGASTSAVLSHVPAPVRRSKPSGDIKNYLFRRSTQWTKDLEKREEEEREQERISTAFVLRNSTPVIKRVPSTPRSLKAMFEKKKIAADNKLEREQQIALRKWRKSRIQDLKLVSKDLDLSMVSDQVLAKVRQITQYGIKRVYNRHLQQRPPSAKRLPTDSPGDNTEDADTLPQLTEEELVDEFNRKMRMVCSGRDIATDPEMLGALREPVDVRSGRSLLHVACQLQRVVHVQVLLALTQHVDVNQTETTQERTALHVAALVGSVEIVVLFLEKSVNLNIDATDNNGWTPLHVAAHAGKTEVVQLLLPLSGQRATLLTNEGDSALHLASSMGEDATVAQMLIFYSKQQSKDNMLESGLGNQGSDETAAVETVGVLRLANNNGEHPLHMAAGNGHLNTVKRLTHSISSTVQIGGCRLAMVREIRQACIVSATAHRNHCAMFLWEDLIKKNYPREKDKFHADIFECAVRGANEFLVARFCKDVKGVENSMGVVKEHDDWNFCHLAAHLGVSSVLTAMVTSGNPDMNEVDANGMRPLDLVRPNYDVSSQLLAALLFL